MYIIHVKTNYYEIQTTIQIGIIFKFNDSYTRTKKNNIQAKPSTCFFFSILYITDVKQIINVIRRNRSNVYNVIR